MEHAALGVVLTRDGAQVLCVQRPDVGYWVLPGGGIDTGEEPSDAAMREVKEETGLDVRVVRLMAHYSPVNRLARETYLFACEPIGGQLRVSTESKKVDFFPLDKLPEPFFFLHKEWLREVMSAEDRVVKRPLSEVSYWRLCWFMLRHPLVFIRFLWSR